MKNDIIHLDFYSIDKYPDILTTKEIQEYLRLTKSALYLLVSQPDFPSFRVGRTIRVKKGDLLKWIDKQKEARSNERVY